MKNIVFYFYPLILVSVFFVHYLIVGQAVYGDGIYYYSYVRSLVIDKNLNFRNEFNHHYNRTNNNAIKEDEGDNYLQRTKTGLFPNKYNIGAPIFWLPSFLFANGFSIFLNMFNKVPTLGYSDIYQIVVGLSNVLFVACGLIVLFRFLKRTFNTQVSFFAISTLLFATNLFYYGALDVVNSHPISFLASSIFMVYFFQTRKNFSYKRYIILGILIGLLGLIRAQDIIFILVIFLEDVVFLLNKERKVSKLIFKNLLMVFFVFITFSPQLVIWKIVFGSYLADPYISSGEYFNLMRPHVFDLMANSKNGLLSTSPILIISFYFLFKKAFLDTNYKKSKEWFLYLSSFCIVCIEYYLIASWSGWSQGESYGIRMLISSFPFLALGLASFFQSAINKFGLVKTYLIVLLFSSINLSTIFYFLLIGQSPTFIGDKNSQDLIIQKFKNLLR